MSRWRAGTRPSAVTTGCGRSCRCRLRGDGSTYLPAGLPQLRHAVAGYYTDLGLPTTYEQIMITSGAQQALRLVATALLEPGSVVLIEEPSFRGAIEVLRSAGAQLIPVPSGPQGVDVAALRAAVRTHRPAMVLVQSTVHNPAGSVLDVSGRRALGELGVPVLDDATLCDTLIDGPAPRPTAAYGGPVITIGSARQSFWGGLRVGWLRADPPTVASLTSVKGGEDLGTSVLAQLVTARLLPQIELARDRRREALRAARGAVADTIGRLLPEWRFHVPAGGASLWVQLPMPCATSFAQAAERGGVALLPGPTFSCADALDDFLRISYAPPPSANTRYRRLSPRLRTCSIMTAGTSPSCALPVRSGNRPWRPWPAPVSTS